VTVIEAEDWHALAGSVSRSRPRGTSAVLPLNVCLPRQNPDPTDEDFVWGVAYRIDPIREVEVRAYLGEPASTQSGVALIKLQNIERRCSAVRVLRPLLSPRRTDIHRTKSTCTSSVITVRRLSLCMM
jgi:hypothetical protein